MIPQAPRFRFCHGGPWSSPPCTRAAGLCAEAMAQHWPSACGKTTHTPTSSRAPRRSHRPAAAPRCRWPARPGRWGWAAAAAAAAAGTPAPPLDLARRPQQSPAQAVAGWQQAGLQQGPRLPARCRPASGPCQPVPPAAAGRRCCGTLQLLPAPATPASPASAPGTAQGRGGVVVRQTRPGSEGPWCWPAPFRRVYCSIAGMQNLHGQSDIRAAGRQQTSLRPALQTGA